MPVHSVASNFILGRFSGGSTPGRRGEKITVGLVSHWLCVRDNNGISTYELTALEREMNTPPTLQPE